MPLDFELKV